MAASSSVRAGDIRQAHQPLARDGRWHILHGRQPPGPRGERLAYNALYVSLNKQGRWNFTIFFWPKAFTPGNDIPLVFTFGGVKDVKALGKAADAYAVTLSNIGASFRDDVAQAQRGQMIVAAEGLTTQLHFDVSDVAAVFAALEECAKTLR